MEWVPPSLPAALAGAACVLAALLAAHHLHTLVRRPGEAQVQWTWLPILGDAIHFGKDPIGFLTARKKASGDRGIFGVLVGGSRMFFLTDPRAAGLLFRPDKQKISFDPIGIAAMTQAFGSSECPFTGNNPALPSGSLAGGFRAQYQQHLLSDGGLAPITGRMQRAMNRLATSMPRHERAVNLKQFIYDFAMRAAVAGVFNEALAEDPRIQENLFAFDAKFALLLGGLPIELFPAARAARSFMQAAMRHSFPAPAGVGDTDMDTAFMAGRERLMLEHRLSDTDIGCVQFSFLWASAANTMPTTYWVLYFMLRNPAAAAAVQREMQEVFGSRAPSAAFDLNDADLARLKVLDSCITETLRLTAGPLVVREVTAPSFTFTLPSGEALRFRQGDRLMLFPYFQHHDPELFPNPEAFQHDRFVDPPLSYRKAGYSVPFSAAVMPFGGGATYCPGRKFARNEIKTIAAYLLANFNVSLADPSELGATDYTADIDYGRVGTGTFPPVRGVTVKISPKYA